MVGAEKRATDGGTLLMKATYVYDAWGNRIEKSVDNDGAGAQNPEVQRYAYDGWKHAVDGMGRVYPLVGMENWDALLDLDGSNAVQMRYLRGDGIDQLFARVSGAGVAAWYLPDRLGTVRDITNVSGTVQTTMTFGGFGQLLSETNASWRGRFLYTGREYEGETFLQYSHARYYDTFTGRWTSEDPIGFAAGDANLYRYVHNNAANVTDPSGLQDYDAKNTLKGPFAISFGKRMRAVIEVDADITSIGRLGKAIAGNPAAEKGTGEPGRIGVAITVSDLDKGKEEAGGKGERVWVAFHNTATVIAPGYSKKEVEEAWNQQGQPPIGKWHYDWVKSIDQLPTTASTDFFDYPGMPFGNQSPSMLIQGTLLVGIACRLKNNKRVFQNKLLDEGTIAYTLVWDKATQTATVEVKVGKQWASQDVTGDVVSDGKWIELLGGGAVGGK